MHVSGIGQPLLSVPPGHVISSKKQGIWHCDQHSVSPTIVVMGTHVSGNTQPLLSIPPTQCISSGLQSMESTGRHEDISSIVSLPDPARLTLPPSTDRRFDANLLASIRFFVECLDALRIRFIPEFMAATCRCFAECLDALRIRSILEFMAATCRRVLSLDKLRRNLFSASAIFFA
jgi:hypothetical protein